MIHNTGLYGPNEAPINMGAPINMSQLNVPIIPHNLNNLSKIPQQPSHPTTGSYNLPNFPPYGHQSMNIGPQIPSLPNYHSNLFHNGFMNAPTSTTTLDMSWQNGMLPMNLNAHNQQAHSAFHFQNFDKTPNSESKNEICQKVPLNIPQFQSKSDPKEVPGINDQPDRDLKHQESYNNNFKLNTERNLDLTAKPSDILDQDVTRRKTLENTIKLIENILVNTTKNREQDTSRENVTKKPPETEITKESDSKEDDTVDNATASEHEASESEEDVKPNISNVNENDITIKQEPVLIEVDSIFHHDVNGVSRDEVKDCWIIDCETSVSAATEAIKTGTKSNAYYECPHCKLLLQHPKRFLVHTKWHVFGLTRAKRMEMARVKSERRLQLREERDRLHEITPDDVVTGKTFPCKDCDKIFGTRSGLKNHRQRLHTSIERECKICKITVVGWAELRAHIASHADDSAYRCDLCPKRFKYLHSLAKHRDTHLEKVHGCDQCPKKYGSQALLKMHLKTHERALRGTTFRCTYCGKGFYESWNLQVHERTHRNERPFLCEICNTAFGTNSSLKRHVKVSHSSSKPHECSTCHRCFISAVILQRHERRAHGDPEEFKFVCKLCECRYLTSKDLQKHIYKVHPKVKRKMKSESDSE
ncbi:zinc finger protein 79-like [Amyelois transitella]|uniref:zinc finger protein 79-like n=1 Tax=Amyelois transitella TaxID=680683 RepID=UPI00067BF8CD|nr:zinc finger protein 79-like [Amyelois transitella]